MDRRRFLLTSLAGALAAPLAAEAQPAGKVWRIGFLTPIEVPREPLIEALRDLGYVEGQTIRLDVRSADNHLSASRGSPSRWNRPRSTSSWR